MYLTLIQQKFLRLGFSLLAVVNSNPLNTNEFVCIYIFENFFRFQHFIWTNFLDRENVLSGVKIPINRSKINQCLFVDHMSYRVGEYLSLSLR